MSLVAISDLFNFEKGTLQSSKCVAGVYNFLTASAEWKTHNEFTCDCEALVFAAAASGSLGRTHYVNGKFIASDLCFIITPKDEQKYPIDLQFYHILFNELKKDIVKSTKAGTSKEAIGLKSFGKYKLPYFDIEKQRKIKSKFLESNDLKNELITEQETQLAYLKHLRQQILSNAIQGKLDLPHTDGESGEDLLARIKAEKAKTTKKEKTLLEIKADDIPFDIPEHWVWCRLGEICRVKVGATPSRSEPKYWKGDIPWVASGEVANNYISDTKEKISQEGFNSTSLIMYPKGSVLVAMIGQGKTRGQTAVLKIDATTNQNVAGLVIEHKYLLSEYLWYFFLSRYETTRSGASGGNQPALNGIKISNTLFPLPPMSEQIELVRKMDNLMALCDELEASIRQNQEYTQMLYQTALREALQKPA